MNEVWCRCLERKQRLPCANLWRPVPGPSMCWSTGCSVHTRRRRTGPARPRTSSWRWTWGCHCSGWPAGPPPCTGGRRLAHTRGRATGWTPLWTTSGASRQDGRKWGRESWERTVGEPETFSRPQTVRAGWTWEQQPRSHPSYVCLQQRAVQWTDVALCAGFHGLKDTAPSKPRLYV